MKRVLVANRGEIAVRILRTLRGMGLESVAVFTDADRGALHVRLADQAVPLGPARAYLEPAALVAAAAVTGADTLHPGYGFLSENPVLARQCADAGVLFVGPPPQAIELMGDKIRAKQTVSAAGVPIVPGTADAGLSDEELIKAALDVGLPVLLKPSAGGGGKGMVLVDEPGELAAAVTAARRQAQAAFGDGNLMVERYVHRPRHIEVQVFADHFGRVVALGERECSLQRRHQKIVEEAPSPLLDETARAAISAAAVRAAEACGYVNAGTVEFIVPGDHPSDFFFMEMNTRLQVEHPVTELVLGVDLVECQLKVAAGEPLPWDEPPVAKGHAVEARIYAEDAGRDFLPATGTVRRLREPDGLDGVRVDSGLCEGLVVGTEYDPMLAKVVAWATDRDEALNRLDRALAATAVLGVTTNVGFLRRLVNQPDVRAGNLDTTLVERLAGDRPPADDPVPAETWAAVAWLDHLLHQPAGPLVDPWLMVDGWRLSVPVPIRSTWTHRRQEMTVELRPDGSVAVGPAPAEPFVAELADMEGELAVETSDGRRAYQWAREGDRYWLGRDGEAWELELVRETVDRAGPSAVGSGDVTSPMPGTVLAVYVSEGDAVQPGQSLLSVEAMKMEHVVKAPFAGSVRDVMVQAGDRVTLDQRLVSVEAEPE